MGFITVGQWLWKMLICFIYFIVTLYPIGLFYEAHFLGPLPSCKPSNGELQLGSLLSVIFIN